MRYIIPLLLALFLGACATLPKYEPTQSTEVANWLLPELEKAEVTRLNFCEVNAPRQSCDTSSPGLQARGLGGFFLPLDVSIPDISTSENQTRLKVTINGIDARCSKGSFKASDDKSSAVVGGIFCNWAVIGNVISSLKLTFDWDDPTQRSFGGRYVIRFYGTGSGSGSGFYTARAVP